MPNGKFIDHVQKLKEAGDISTDAAVQLCLDGVSQLYTLIDARIPENLPDEHKILLKFKNDWEGKIKIMYGLSLIIGTALIGGIGSIIFLFVTHQVELTWLARP